MIHGDVERYCWSSPWLDIVNKDILAFQIVSLTIFYLGKKFILSAKEQVRTEMKGMRQKFGSCTQASMSSYYAK